MVLEPRPFLLGDILRHFMHLYHGTVVHITTKNNIDKIIFRYKPFIYKQFQAVSGRLIRLKTPKMAQKHAFCLKKSQKSPIFVHFGSKSDKNHRFFTPKKPVFEHFKNIWYSPGGKIF